MNLAKFGQIWQIGEELVQALASSIAGVVVEASDGIDLWFITQNDELMDCFMTFLMKFSAYHYVPKMAKDICTFSARCLEKFKKIESPSFL